MRYPVLLSAFLFFFGLSSFAQSKKQIRSLKIKSVTETESIYDKTTGKLIVTYKAHYKTFDANGETTLEVDYFTDGTVKKKQTTKYSGKNKIEEITDNDKTGKKDKSDADTTDVDKDKYKKIDWSYNAKGDKTQEIKYDDKGNVVKKTTYAYSNDGDLMFEMEYDGSGNLLKKIAYGYNSKGLRSEKKIYGPGGTILQKDIVYTYTF